MQSVTDVITGAIKLNGFMEGKCFTGWADFLKQIPNILSVEIPNNITNVTIGSSEPSDSERENLWFKEDASGNPIGIFIYYGGSWKQFLPVPQEIFFVYGDSSNPPPGYTLVSSSPAFAPAQVTNMQKIWTSVPGSNPVTYSTFHVIFTGF